MTKRRFEPGYLYVPYAYLRKNKNGLFASRFRLYKKKECERRRRYTTNLVKSHEHLQLAGSKHRCSYCRGLYWKVAYYRGYMLCLFCFQKKDVIEFILFSDSPHEISMTRIRQDGDSSPSPRKVCSGGSSKKGKEKCDEKPLLVHEVDEDDLDYPTFSEASLLQSILEINIPPSPPRPAHQGREKEENFYQVKDPAPPPPLPTLHLTPHSIPQPASHCLVLPPPPYSIHSSSNSSDDGNDGGGGISVDILPTYDSDFWILRALSLFL